YNGDVVNGAGSSNAPRSCSRSITAPSLAGFPDQAEARPPPSDRRRLFRPFATGPAHVLDVEPGLPLAQDGVVDAPLVAQPDHRGPFAGDPGEAQRGVLLVVAQRPLVLGLAVAGAQHAQVLLVLAAYPSGDLRV